MATLPDVGGDIGTWGTELNTWLGTEHNADGSHNDDVFFNTLGTKLLFNMNGDIMVNRSGELVFKKE